MIDMSWACVLYVTSIVYIPLWIRYMVTVVSISYRILLFYYFIENYIFILTGDHLSRLSAFGLVHTFCTLSTIFLLRWKPWSTLNQDKVTFIFSCSSSSSSFPLTIKGGRRQGVSASKAKPCLLTKTYFHKLMTTC